MDVVSSTVTVADESMTTWASHTADNPTTPSPSVLEVQRIQGVAIDVYFYGLSIIIPVGLVCNIFTVCVFCCSAVLRRSTTGQYLTILAVADSLVLVGDGMRWLNIKNNLDIYYTGLDFMDRSNVTCKGVYLLRYSCKMMSAWITVAITVERLIAVAMPMKVANISTTRRVRIALAGMSVICLVLGSYPLWTHGIASTNGSPMCEMISESALVWQLAINWIATIAIPDTLIAVFTGIIIAFLYRARRKRKMFMEGRAIVIKVPGHSDSTAGGMSVETQLTMMLVSICVTCLCLQVPYAIAYNINRKKLDIWGLSIDIVFSAKIYATYKIFDMIATANYAVNFFLYCLCGTTFRRQIARCGHKEHNTSITEHSKRTQYSSCKETNM